MSFCDSGSSVYELTFCFSAAAWWKSAKAETRFSHNAEDTSTDLRVTYTYMMYKEQILQASGVANFELPDTARKT